MTHRERFLNTMAYAPVDRGIITDFGFWDETLVIWQDQGLPEGITMENYGPFFGVDPWQLSAPVNVGLAPGFPYILVEDQGDHEIVQDHEGVRVRRGKFMGSIPEHIAHLLIDRDSWRWHYRSRLNPATEYRIPAADSPEWKAAIDPNRTQAVVAWGGSLYGWIRNWMGVEAVSLAVYDDPAWFGEMVETCGDCIVGTLQRAIDQGLRPDAVNLWEDMCYNRGPLLSPTHFKEYLVPQYRRITDLVRSVGCETVWVDCDGDTDALIPLWLDAGVNTMFPMEVGTWNGEPGRIRAKFGRDLRMMGGFDKHILARSTEEITAEVERLAPLVEEGGFIPFPDHRVPPDVPLDHFVHYLQEARRVWGHSAPDLLPMQPTGSRFVAS